MKLRYLIIFFAPVFISQISFAQQQMKIMTYNLLNYPSPDTNVRNPYFRTVISSANPDVLVVSEIGSQAGVNQFLQNVMNHAASVYSAGTFIDGPDTDNAIYYKTSKFNFINNSAIHTALRDINEFKITDKFYDNVLIIYAVHLKANQGEEALRAAEVDSLRKRTNQLPAGSQFMVLGDFNIYGSTEPAYQKLIQNNPNDDGNFLDPFTLTGTWNQFAYRQYHTQSTRVRSFGNGATGGLDDRFDMILYSNGVNNPGGIKYVPGTYVAYGNDANHYNDSINQIPNTAVTQTVATALHYASDHLPVYATFEFGNSTTLNVKVILEGFYNTFTNRISRRDTILLYLRNSISPYQKVDSSKAVLDTITFNAAGIFRSAFSGSYYLVVRHLNSIETWSKAGGMQYHIDSTKTYDFTNSSSQAFGNNLVLRGSKYCIYSGDTNQDGLIDSGDLLMTYNDAVNFASGYLATDVNGDWQADVSDITIVYNNLINFIGKIVP